MSRGRNFREHWKELLASENGLQGQGSQTTKDENERQDAAWNSARVLLRRYGWLAASLAILVVCVVLADGRSERPDRVRVSGQVLIDGKPLTLGIVNFVPDAGRGSTATLDEQGCFTLTCIEASDGAVPGAHRIEVALDGAPGDMDEPWDVPNQYANFQTSGLCCQIIEPTDGLTIELASGG